MVSSKLIEFVVAIVVGLLAISGALFLVGFLLIHPVRIPPSDTSISTATALNSSGCPLTVDETVLPSHCSWNGRGSIPLSRCSLSTCSCKEQLAAPTTCCCRAISQNPVSGIDCGGAEVPAPLMFDVTDCGCRTCDDIEVTISITVVTGSTRDPVIAAQVYSMDQGDGFLRLQGITGNGGQFTYRVQVAVGGVTLSIQAPGYMRHDTDRMRILPNVPVIAREIVLIRTVRITIDNSGSVTSVPLNPVISLFLPPNSFVTAEGEQYSGNVVYEGIFLDSSSEDLAMAVPKPDFRYVDSNGVMQTFGFFYGIRGSFLNVNGEKLNMTNNVQLSFSLEGTQDLDVFLLNFNTDSNNYEMAGSVSRTEGTSRRKRQTPRTQVFNGTLVNLDTFNMVATQFFVNCFVQVRAFTSSDADLSGAIVQLSQLATVNDGTMDELVLFIFTVELGGRQSTAPDNLTDNAACIALACDRIENTQITATQSGTPLVPVSPPSGLFSSSPNLPMVLGTAFVFRELSLATPNNSFPFFDNVSMCRAEGQEVSAGVSSPDYLSFRADTIQQISGSGCFAKVIVRDCFPVSRITARSVSGGFQTVLDVETFINISTSTEMVTSGTMPPELATDPATEPATEEVATTEMPDFMAPTSCDASTATLRVGCIQFDCGIELQLTAQSDQPTLPLMTFGNQCSLSQFAPLLSTVSRTSTQELQIETNRLLTSDFNNPALGLYFEPGNGTAATMVAEERCNAGSEIGSADIDPTVGITAEFTCYF